MRLFKITKAPDENGKMMAREIKTKPKVPAPKIKLPHWVEDSNGDAVIPGSCILSDSVVPGSSPGPSVK